MINLPTIESYAGEHAQRLDIGNLTVWFSYKTVIAFKVLGGARVVRENDWGPTTGKHLNAIDGGNRKGRVSGAEFEAQWAMQVGPHADPLASAIQQSQTGLPAV